MDAPVAIVGMSCRFAGAHSPADLWDVIMSRRSQLTKPGIDAELPPGHRNLFSRPYPARIGQLGEGYACIPSMQNFPRQVNAGENQDMYFATQLAFDALADAGIKRRRSETLRGSVRFGYAPPFNASTLNWLEHTVFLDQTMEILHRFLQNAPADALDLVREKLVESLPAPNAASFLLGAGYRLASWIARECGFSGAATIMDAGMVTGAATLMDAVDDLLTGKVDVALAGSLTPPLSAAYLEGLSGEVPFSGRPELHPFAEEADGTLPGEGGAFFVLKRRADALRDHDRIYALIRSVAIGHNPDDDASVLLAEACSRVEVPVTSIGLIEADGSGIAKAEQREIEAIQKLWGVHHPGGPLVGLGSVKGNVGHTLHAAMSAGVLKAALALSHRVLPPQLAPERIKASLSTLQSSAYLLTEGRPWITDHHDHPRRAAVMGANFDAVSPTENSFTSGRSAVVLLEEEPEASA